MSSYIFMEGAFFCLLNRWTKQCRYSRICPVQQSGPLRLYQLIVLLIHMGSLSACVVYILACLYSVESLCVLLIYVDSVHSLFLIWKILLYKTHISLFSLPGLTADKTFASPLLFGVVTIKKRVNLLAVNPSLTRKRCTCYLNPSYIYDI